MLHAKDAIYCILCCLLLQIEAIYVEKNDLCVNSSDVLWNSLDFWNGANLFRKWKIEAVGNLDLSCSEELNEMIEGAHNGSLWASKMFDASGHYEGGIFEGNEYWLGSNTQCQNLQLSRTKTTPSNMTSMNEYEYYRKTSENRFIKTDHNDFVSAPPFTVKFAVVKLNFKMKAFCHLNNETESVLYVGLCLPSSCGVPDVRATLEWAMGKDFIEVDEIKLIPGDYSPWTDSRFYFLSALLFVVTFLITLATFLEYIDLNYGRKFSATFWYPVLHAFSLIGNLKSVCSLKVGGDTLAPVHGLKFISMMWVVLVHTCLMLFHVAGNKKFRDESEKDFLYQTISSATYSVDTFFTLSGVLVSFLFFRTLTKYPVKELIWIDGALGHVALYICMLGFRLIRLSLPYLVMVVLTGFLTEQKMNTTPLVLPNRDHINCVDYWWRNALYINTFYPVNEMCMVWSWYLSVDTQFYVIGVPILLLAMRFRFVALILGSVCLIFSWITTGIISYQTDHVIDVRDPFANYDELYDKPWTRVGPYFAGLATGWYLFHINCKLNLSRQLNIFLWICSFSTMICIIYGPMYLPINKIFSILYTCFSHTMWSTAISWILIACVTENGFLVNHILSWKYMYPFSRLSYCAYLVHPLIIRMVLLSSDKSYFINIEILSTLFLGFLVLSLMFAGLLTLAFESPVVALVRLIHPMRRRKS